MRCHILGTVLLFSGMAQFAAAAVMKVVTEDGTTSSWLVEEGQDPRAVRHEDFDAELKRLIELGADKETLIEEINGITFKSDVVHTDYGSFFTTAYSQKQAAVQRWAKRLATEEVEQSEPFVHARNDIGPPVQYQAYCEKDFNGRRVSNTYYCYSNNFDRQMARGAYKTLIVPMLAKSFDNDNVCHELNWVYTTVWPGEYMEVHMEAYRFAKDGCMQHDMDDRTQVANAVSNALATALDHQKVSFCIKVAAKGGMQYDVKINLRKHGCYSYRVWEMYCQVAPGSDFTYTNDCKDTQMIDPLP